MAIANLKRLRTKLPPHYGALIARNLVGISRRQVLHVFSGVITNPDIVEKVLIEANALAAKTARIKRMAVTKKAKKRA